MTDYGEEEEDDVLAFDAKPKDKDISSSSSKQRPRSNSSGGGGGKSSSRNNRKGKKLSDDEEEDDRGLSLDRPAAYSDAPNSRYTDETPPRANDKASRKSNKNKKYDDDENDDDDGDAVEKGNSGANFARNPINFLDYTGEEASL
jgi:hypothetical protein